MIQSPSASQTPGPIDGEQLKLQAENTALQKNVAPLQEQYKRKYSIRLRTGVGPEPPTQEAEPADRQTPDSSPSQTQQLLMEKEEQRLLKEGTIAECIDCEKNRSPGFRMSWISALKIEESFLQILVEKETPFSHSKTTNRGDPGQEGQGAEIAATSHHKM